MHDCLSVVIAGEEVADELGFTGANRARLRDDNGQKFRKEPDGGLCPIKLLSQMKATGGAPLLSAEIGCWHEDQHMLLAEAQAYLRNEMCKVKCLPAVAACLRHLHACLGRSVADKRKKQVFWHQTRTFSMDNIVHRGEERDMDRYMRDVRQTV